MTTPAPPKRPRPTTILLPPSEGKAAGGDGPSWDPADGAFGDLLGTRRRAVADALRSCRGGDERLLGVRGAHLDRAAAANRSLLGAPTLPAWQRYTGVVWEHLDPGALRAAERRTIVVISGLHGLVRADDPLPDYRLKMGASLPPLGKLAAWWRDELTDAIASRLGRRFVVDLLPNEHRAALDLDRLRGRVHGATVVFRERSGGSGGHAAKAAKGRLAHHLATSELPALDALDTWRDERFVLDVSEW